MARLWELDGVREDSEMLKGTDTNLGEPMYFQKECCNKPIDGKERQEIIHWQSDYSVVSKKSLNRDGEKGIAVMREDAKDTSAGLRTGEQMKTKLAFLTQRAKKEPKSKFTSLAHLLTANFLGECFQELKRNKAPGIDRVTVKEYEVNLEEKLKDLVVRLKTKKYKPQPVRRTYIPKTGGGKRPLGIPTVEDKLIQMGIKKILEAIYEVDFLDVSYGFRPNRNCHSALDMLNKVIMTRNVSYVVDMDMEKFFDTIDHGWLMECVKQRVKDATILRLINKMLKAGIMENGKFSEMESGTPQGGVLSPLLANIYLHYILDLWFEKRVKKSLIGYAELIRYCDDFVVCFHKWDDAKSFGDELKKRLGKFGLGISEEKSRTIKFGRYVWQRAQQIGGYVKTFDFLGFTHYCEESRKGTFKVGRKTASLKFKKKIKDINLWMKRTRNMVKLDVWWGTLRLKLMGHYRYYGINGNIQSMLKFYRLVLRLAYKWINRRSQMKSFNYGQYFKFLTYNPLPRPKIYHSTYILSSQ